MLGYFLFLRAVESLFHLLLPAFVGSSELDHRQVLRDKLYFGLILPPVLGTETIQHIIVFGAG